MVCGWGGVKSHIPARPSHSLASPLLDDVVGWVDDLVSPETLLSHSLTVVCMFSVL